VPVSQPDIKVTGINHSISLNLDNQAEKRKLINQKLNGLSDEERIEVQTYGLRQIEELVKLKVERRSQLKSEFDRLKIAVVEKNEQVRSVAEIDALKAEIRNLTNEKFRLESIYRTRKQILDSFALIHFLKTFNSL